MPDMSTNKPHTGNESRSIFPERRGISGKLDCCDDPKERQTRDAFGYVPKAEHKIIREPDTAVPLRRLLTGLIVLGTTIPICLVLTTTSAHPAAPSTADVTAISHLGSAKTDSPVFPA
jgi:hypothetical protein